MVSLPPGWPDTPPVYDIHKTYLENLEQGPFFAGTIPPREFPPEKEWKTFLDLPLATPLGIPAGPLLSGKWVLFAAQMGFDVVTYKTIRSQYHPAHPLPNMVYVNTQGALHAGRQGERLQAADRPPQNLEELAATNSFGIPSREPKVLLEDIAHTQAALAKGQILIVSIVGTPRPGEDYIEDFVRAALLAKEGGAPVIEADLSCPNLGSCEGEIFMDPELVFTLSQKIVKAIHPIPLIIKVGFFPDLTKIEPLLLAAARAGVRAVCGINTISMPIVRPDGTPLLGEKRLRAGVCGAPIRGAALDFVENASSLNKKLGLDLAILGTGGITQWEHFSLFLEKGADIAMSAVGFLWDPYLAARYHQQKEAL